MKFFASATLGPKRKVTPEGFIVCEAVPIARTGEMIYGADEVPVEPGRDGIVRIARGPDEVFRPETIASFEGKAVTIEHPGDFVTPENWRQLAVGTVQNVRRGSGTEDNLLLADLVITDPQAIAMVQDNGDLPEVSCGYEADYEQTEPGRGVQLNIIGNHVALVERGRCGPRCAIGDHQKGTEDMKTKDSKKRTWKDRLMTAFKARDEEAMKEAMDEAEQELGAEGGEPQKIVIEVKGQGEAAPAADEGEGEQKDEDPVAQLTAQVAALTEMVKKLAGGQAADEDPVKDEDGEQEEQPTSDEGEEQEPTKTGDSLKASLKDVIARAEILAPGQIKAPTLDGKDPKKAKDAICGCKRKALDAALQGKHGESIKALLGGKTVDKLACATVDTVFVAASELVKTINNAGAVRSGITTKDFGRTTTPAAINQRHADFWSKRG